MSAIYKVYCDESDMLYIGSTSNFTQRKCQHLQRIRLAHSGSKSQHNIYDRLLTIHDNYENWKIEVVESLAIDCTKLEREQREREIIETYDKDKLVNFTIRPRITVEERKQYQHAYHGTDEAKEVRRRHYAEMDDVDKEAKLQYRRDWGSKRVNCSKCQKELANKSLKEHEARCNPNIEFEFECTLCDYKCHHPQTMDKHNKLKHSTYNIITIYNVDSTKSNCPICDKEMNKTSINLHVQRFHPNCEAKIEKEKVSQLRTCPHCNKEMLRTSLHLHLKKFHNS